MKTLAVCFRTALLKQYVDYGHYKKVGYVVGDYPSYLDLSNHTEVGYIDQSLACYRYVPGSVSRPVDPNAWVVFTKRAFRVAFEYADRYGASAATKSYMNGLFHSFLVYSSCRLALNGQVKNAIEVWKEARLLPALRWLTLNLPRKCLERLRCLLR